MSVNDLEYIKDRVRREVERCREAPCPEVAERHRHLAQLYAAQLELLMQKHRSG